MWFTNFVTLSLNLVANQVVGKKNALFGNYLLILLIIFSIVFESIQVIYGRNHGKELSYDEDFCCEIRRSNAADKINPSAVDGCAAG